MDQPNLMASIWMEEFVCILRVSAYVLTLYLLVPPDDNLCKQIGPRSGPTFVVYGAWSGSYLFALGCYSWKDWFWKKKSADVKRAWKTFPRCWELTKNNLKIRSVDIACCKYMPQYIIDQFKNRGKQCGPRSDCSIGAVRWPRLDCF